MSLFETGTIVNTIGIREMLMNSSEAVETVQRCLDRHCRGDWGDLCDDDKQLNQESLNEEKEKGFSYSSLFSTYETEFGKIYIITECDRFVTTILLAEEY